MTKLTKIERYDWAVPGDKGIDRMISIAELKVDHSYQRQEVSDANTLGIARNFSWSAFGSLVVMKRKNGDHYVVDGQQRLLAVKRRGDIKTVPCRVFESTGPEREAVAFVDLNIHRKRVTAMERFRACVEAGIEPEKSIAAWASEAAFVVTDNGHVQGRIDFPALLKSTWERDAEKCKSALILQREIIGHELMNSYIHRGLMWLLINNVDVESEKKKLMQSGGKAAILRAIKTVEIQVGQKASHRISGWGLLNLINFKRRKRVVVHENGDEYGRLTSAQGDEPVAGRKL